MVSEYKLLTINTKGGVAQYKSTEFNWHWSDHIVEVWMVDSRWQKIYPMSKIINMTEEIVATCGNLDPHRPPLNLYDGVIKRCQG